MEVVVTDRMQIVVFQQREQGVFLILLIEQDRSWSQESAKGGMAAIGDGTRFQFALIVLDEVAERHAETPVETTALVELVDVGHVGGADYQNRLLWVVGNKRKR